MKDQPNFLFLFPDQWRWDWLGCEDSPYGKVPVQTPNIDALAERGIRFSGCRTCAPLCSPARACLALGERPPGPGVPDNQHCTPLDRPTVFSLLRASGYHTATCGKSDLFKPLTEPSQTGYYPVMDTLGFSDGIDHHGKGQAVIYARKGIDDPYIVLLKEQGELQTHLDDHPPQPLERAAAPTALPDELTTDAVTGRHALKLLNRTPENKPWCLWVNFPGPHDPYDPPAELLSRYDGIAFPGAVAPTDDPPAYRDVEKDRLHYAACCSHIDDEIGRLLAEVDRRGERDNTVVVFASDHGEMLGDHGRWQKSIWNEGSLRVPLIVAGPGVESGGVSRSPVELIDISATILDLAGVKVPGTWDAKPFSSCLKNPAIEHRKYAVSQLEDWRCVTSNEWKYVEYREQAPRLFDLSEDPQELHNVAEKYPQRCATFAHILEEASPWERLGKDGV